MECHYYYQQHFLKSNGTVEFLISPTELFKYAQNILMSIRSI